jgi:hypothetical protein
MYKKPLIYGYAHIYGVHMKKIAIGLILVGLTLPAIVASPAQKIAPGIYTGDTVSDLPLPKSGYDLYIVAEEHGIDEVHQFFLDYVTILYETAGLRDIIIEFPQGYQRLINEYTHGDTDEFDQFFGTYLKVVVEVRALNETLPDNEKIYIHCMDIDYVPRIIYMHMVDIKAAIDSPAEDIEIPPIEDSEKWKRQNILAVVDQLVAVAPEKLNKELETVRASIESMLAASRWKSVNVREEALVKNIQYILQQDTPVLALMGYWHGQKKESTGHSSGVQPCTQQLIELGVTLYTVQVTGISGYVWTEEFKTSAHFNDPENIEFPDNSTLSDILEEAPEYHMVYIDFQQEENASISLGISSIYYRNEAAEIFDSLVLYKYFTPLWPGEIFEEANSLFEKGVNAFEKGNYEQAITYFKQSREKFAPWWPEKVEECDGWIEKSQNKSEGFCVGSVLLVLMVGAGLFWRRMTNVR